MYLATVWQFACLDFAREGRVRGARGCPPFSGKNSASVCSGSLRVGEERSMVCIFETFLGGGLSNKMGMFTPWFFFAIMLENKMKELEGKQVYGWHLPLDYYYPGLCISYQGWGAAWFYIWKLSCKKRSIPLSMSFFQEVLWILLWRRGQGHRQCLLRTFRSFFYLSPNSHSNQTLFPPGYQSKFI